MRTRFVLSLSMLLVVLLTACDLNFAGAPVASPAPTTAASAANTNATPGGGQRPAAQGTRPANFTPGGQRPTGQGTPGGQRPAGPATAAPRATPTPSAATKALPTAVVVTVLTPLPPSAKAPTAVPIPNIVIPTQIPQAPATPAPTISVEPSSSSTQPTVRRTPTPTPNIEELRGKIVFFSDRAGGYPQLYVMNPDGSDVRLCHCSELWESLFNQENYSPDKSSYLYVRAAGARGADMQIWAHYNETNSDAVLTGNAPNFPTVDYDAVWSPDGRYIAWVSEVDGNDEIYLLDTQLQETKRLTTNSFEWDKRPSFSPDGSRIVFWSNRDTSRKQIWVMNRDGAEPINLSQNEYNDWDPLWVK
jgi:hypothetical protein